MHESKKTKKQNKLTTQIKGCQKKKKKKLEEPVTCSKTKIQKFSKNTQIENFKTLVRLAKKKQHVFCLVAIVFCLCFFFVIFCIVCQSTYSRTTRSINVSTIYGTGTVPPIMATASKTIIINCVCDIV